MAMLVMKCDVSTDLLMTLGDLKLKVKATNHYQREFKRIQAFCRQLHQNRDGLWPVNKVESLIRQVSELMIMTTIADEIQANCMTALTLSENLSALCQSLQNQLDDFEFNLNRDFELSTDDE